MNSSLIEFNKLFPKESWDDDFKQQLINEFSFFSSKIEDPKIEYGDTIKFLNDELIRIDKNIKSLYDISNHKEILTSLIENYDDFNLDEKTILKIHSDLMSSENTWNIDFKPHLVGQYRNIPTIGHREPFFENREYAEHYKLDMIMASYIDIFNHRLNTIDNSKEDKHLITQLAYFHNKFLNDIHPFADGNGRVCRIIMGTIMMKNDCPPIFAKIKSDEDRFNYISSIIECEKSDSDLPFIKFFADSITEYLKEKIKANS